MNLAAFAVIAIRERETPVGDDIRSVAGLGARAAGARLAADDLHARARRPARHRRLHRQALPDRGRGRRRLHLARRGDRDRVDDLARLLPAGDRGGLDAARGRARAPARVPGDGRRLAGGRRRGRRRRAAWRSSASRPGRRGDGLLRHHPPPLVDWATAAGDSIGRCSASSTDAGRRSPATARSPGRGAFRRVGPRPGAIAWLRHGRAGQQCSAATRGRRARSPAAPTQRAHRAAPADGTVRRHAAVGRHRRATDR